LRFLVAMSFSVLEFYFGEVFVASWADPSSGIDTAEGWLMAGWAEFFVHREQLRSFLGK
jgi:hypothetical protein